jgi:hypothetical protein
VSKTEVKNLAASIHQRLSNQARRAGRPLNELLQYYAIERFLYRLSSSSHVGQFVLKGALLFRLWGLSASRSTRDIDLLGITGNEVENLVTIVREICAQAVPADGLIFDPATVAGERITEDADYEGVRLRFIGWLGQARLNLQIDVGFGDVIFPPPAIQTYPVLLPMPAPELRTYPPEALVAEKLQAMIYLGSINSRLKDFYDLWTLASRFGFSGPALQQAIQRTFAHRLTDIPVQQPVPFSPQFAREKQAQWQAFLQTASITGAPDQMTIVLDQLRLFILPVFSAIQAGHEFSQAWSLGGPWK